MHLRERGAAVTCSNALHASQVGGDRSQFLLFQVFRGLADTSAIFSEKQSNKAYRATLHISVVHDGAVLYEEPCCLNVLDDVQRGIAVFVRDIDISP